MKTPSQTVLFTLLITRPFPQNAYLDIKIKTVTVDASEQEDLPFINNLETKLLSNCPVKSQTGS